MKILFPCARFRPNRRIPLIATTVPPCPLVGVLGAAPADHATLELRYHGSLAKASRDGDSTAEPAKRFDLYCLATPLADGGREVDFCRRRAWRRAAGPGRRGLDR